MLTILSFRDVRATYKSPAQLVRLKKTLLLNSETFSNWNAVQLTAPSETGQERAFKIMNGFLGDFFEIFCSSSLNLRGSQSFYKTNKQNQILSPPSQQEEHPGRANRPLLRCFLGGERPTGRARTGMWVSWQPVFSHPWCSAWFQLNCLLQQSTNFSGGVFHHPNPLRNSFQRKSNQDGCAPMKSLTFPGSATFTKQHS